MSHFSYGIFILGLKMCLICICIWKEGRPARGVDTRVHGNVCWKGFGSARSELGLDDDDEKRTPAIPPKGWQSD